MNQDILENFISYIIYQKIKLRYFKKFRNESKYFRKLYYIYIYILYIIED